MIYGLDKAKRPILDAKSVIVCEGQFDTIACHLSGIENAVAPQGTALTADHARILKRYAEEVVLCFDSDTAGQQAALRSLDDLLASGLAIQWPSFRSPRPRQFHPGKRRGVISQTDRRRPGFFDQLPLCQIHDADSDRNQHCEGHARGGAEDEQPGADRHLRACHRLGVAADAVRTEFAKRKRTFQRVEPELEEEIPIPEDELPLPKPSPVEFWLLKLALFGEIVEWLESHLELQWVGHHGVQEIYSNTRTCPCRRLPEFARRAAVGAVPKTGDRGCGRWRNIPNPDRQLKDIVLRLRNQFIEARLARSSAT